MLKQIKPMRQSNSRTFDTNDKASENQSPSIADAIEKLELLRNMQLKNIYSKCSHLDDLSTQIVDKYLKRYDDVVDGMR